jgi:hypothetical protein
MLSLIGMGFIMPLSTGTSNENNGSLQIILGWLIVEFTVKTVISENRLFTELASSVR